jgi:RNA polymerase sigma factor (sigma-70 family)
MGSSGNGGCLVSGTYFRHHWPISSTVVFAYGGVQTRGHTRRDKPVNPPAEDQDDANPPTRLLITAELIQRSKDGDRRAIEALMARYRPRLVRWATGRLPSSARSLLDTSDLVQETLLRAMQALDGLEVGAPGMFQAYVRQAILNRIRDQIRWARRRPGTDDAMEEIEDAAPSPLEGAIDADLLEHYERALGQLTEPERQLIHLRVELDLGYEEIAAITNRATSDAARMAVQRTIRKLAEILGPTLRPPASGPDSDD